MTTPQSQLTFGKVVHYTLDQRESRIQTVVKKKYIFADINFFKTLLDVMILFSQILCVLAGVKYSSDEFLQIMKEYDVLPFSYQYSKYMVFIFLGAFTLFLTLKNVKQISYFSRFGVLITFLSSLYVLGHCSLILYYRNKEDQDLLSLKHVKDNQSRSVISTVNFWKPIWPNFFDQISQESNTYEGIAMIPLLFCNARDQSNIAKVFFKCIFYTFLVYLFFAPLCYITYGDQLQYMVLLNLGSGYLATIVKVTFSLSTVFNIGLNFFPILDIVDNLRKQLESDRDEQSGSQNILSTLYI